MGGIAGFLGPESGHEVAAQFINTMTDTIAHDGPDDSGNWIDEDGSVALGNRRLAIVDPSPEGHQPMLSADGRYVITYNGEVYNHHALRKQLEGLGHRFRGHSDTGVLLAAVTEWGLESSLKKFIGMYAFAVWDRRDACLYLARDRIGEKPLYYGWFGDTFVFGSELKCLRAHPWFRADVDRDMLALYLSSSHVPGPRSIYRNVYKLPPTTWLSVRPERTSRSFDPIPYWSLKAVAEEGTAHPLTASEVEATEELES